MSACGIQGIHHQSADGRGQDILCPDLHNTGSSASLQCEEPSKIQVVGEYDEIVCAGVLHDLGVRRGGRPQVRPVDAANLRCSRNGTQNGLRFMSTG